MHKVHKLLIGADRGERMDTMIASYSYLKMEPIHKEIEHTKIFEG